MIAGETKKGVCLMCDAPLTNPNSIGYCWPCAEKAHEEMDRKWPFVVYDGDHCQVESFKTKKDAEEFIYKMKYCYVTEKTF